MASVMYKYFVHFFINYKKGLENKILRGLRDSCNMVSKDIRFFQIYNFDCNLLIQLCVKPA